MKVSIEPHSGIDKSFHFAIPNYLDLKVDYDDVNHAEVDASVKHLKELIEMYWDSLKVESYYEQELINEWHKNEYNLQSDYEDFKHYMNEHGF